MRPSWRTWTTSCPRSARAWPAAVTDSRRAGISCGVAQRKFALQHGLAAYFSASATSSMSRSGSSVTISVAFIPSATIATTVATGIRRPRMQGSPPITAGSTVMRSKAMFANGRWRGKRRGLNQGAGDRLGVGPRAPCEVDLVAVLIWPSPGVRGEAEVVNAAGHDHNRCFCTAPPLSEKRKVAGSIPALATHSHLRKQSISGDICRSLSAPRCLSGVYLDAPGRPRTPDPASDPVVPRAGRGTKGSGER